MRIAFAFILAFSTSAFAASPYKQSLANKSNAYLQDGVFTGGRAGMGSSLLNVRRTYSQRAAIERVIVDLGDQDMRPTGKKMPYFQASVDAKANRVIVDLAQLQMSRVTETQLKKLFRSSPYVASVEYSVDPADKTGSIILNLKRPMKLEVFQLLAAKKPSRVVLDLTPAAVTSVKRR